ncbi:MAG: bifunctional 4-hydroxy-2-oxoglutarate aldolase/2-dehydro-3-deoxy-phosphogluconate aldolase [Eubacteriales bacterium]|nr:bifunctional 4-hydroxy-2-oxoglutarate aldolase/2-dehydro-3-deoxy-phosphogluconate aldolase [Eubacteriales bacterium]
MDIQRIKVIENMHKNGLVGIVRDKNEEDAMTRTRAIMDGGVTILEISMSTPGALNIISTIAKEIKAKGLDAYVGAGTVLDPETARACILAGASFIIAPNFRPEVAKLCNRYSIAYMPGVQTFTEIVTAMEYGCDIVKIFPASAVGIGFIKAVMGPLPQARCIPVGGVSLDNIDKWFADGAYAVALGSGLTHPTKGTCDYEEIKAHAEKVVAKVRACERK